MAIFNTFSYRKRVAATETTDVYVYDELPKELRVQIAYIWREAIGDSYANNEGWTEIHKIIAKEHGVFVLVEAASAADSCEQYLLTEPLTDNVLDLVEMSFVYIDRVARHFSEYNRREFKISTSADNAIEELNERFRRTAVGYRFEESMIIRVDSEFIHSEIVQPALRYLNEPGFEGPRDEFLKAHAHYRAGETKDAITDANNAFESTLRAVCDLRGWPYERGAPVSALLKILRENRLLPSYLDNAFDQLAATLHSGLPQVRHREGGHGQGATPRETPEFVAGYALHLAATNILFIVEAHKAKG